MNLKKIDFPLVDINYDNAEILSCIQTLLSGQLTMGKRVKEFESIFAQKVGAKFAVFCNSGSSANLLALSAVTNPIYKQRLNVGDSVAVPAVCWSTSLWPIIQMGLTPVLIDVDPLTLNIDVDEFEKAVASKNIKGLVLVHVLGNSTNFSRLLEVIEKNNIVLIEDTCESLGSTFNKKWLGTFGDFGTYSFYFSHHMTTIEGGMVVTNSEENYDLLKALRAHGWSREQSNKSDLESENPHIDPRFLFVNIGYNLRPMEIQAAFGIEQIKRLDEMNLNRRENTLKIRNAFLNHPKWDDQFIFPYAPEGIDACWFGFPMLLSEKITFEHKIFVSNLMRAGIDTRPIISGNMAIQPALKLFSVDTSLGPFLGAQKIHDRGIFFGTHTQILSDERINDLINTIFYALEN